MNDKEIGNRGNKGVLAAALITAFMTTFMGSAVFLSIPSLEVYFGVSAATVNWIVSGYTLTVAACSLPFGKIADATGRRCVFLIGSAGFFILSAVSIFSVNVMMLIIARTLQGAFGAMVFSTNNAILISTYHHSVQGKMLGYSVAATYIGLTAGPVIGGVLNANFGWKSIFAVSFLISAVAFMVSIIYMPDDRVGKIENISSDGIVSDADLPTNAVSKKSGFDLKGGMLYLIWIAMTLYGLTNLTVSKSSLSIFIAGVVMAVLFFYMESRTENPVMDVGIFAKSKVFTFSNFAALFNYCATFAVSYMGSIYLQIVKGLPSDQAGLILIVMPAMQALFSPYMGSLSDKSRPSVIASCGMAVCCVMLVMFSRLEQNSSIAYIIMILCLNGIGFAMFSSPNNNVIMKCVSSSEYGVANSIITTMRTYGQSLGMAVLNIVTGLILGKGSLEAASADNLILLNRVAFTAFAVLCAIGVVFSAVRVEKKK